MSSKNKLKFSTVKSGLKKLEGKYTGKFISTGSDGLDDIAEKICMEHPTIAAPEVKLAVRALASEIRTQVGEKLNYVTDGSVAGFAPAISGSVPSMDAALTKGENEFYVNIVALEPLKSAVGALVPSPTADPSGVRVDYIEDSGSGARGVIAGTGDFIVCGINISATREGEGLELIGQDGGIASAVTVKDAGDASGQRIKAQLATAVDPGAYKLRLTSRGYMTPEAEPNTYIKNVMVTAAA